MTTTEAPSTTSLIGRWAVDPDATRVTFRTTAFLGLMKVNGSLAATSGVVTVHDDGQASGRLAFDVSTIETGIAKRDAHLNRADFFHTEKWPESTFTIQAIRGGGQPSVRGELTIRDAPIRIDTPIEIRDTAGGRTVEATVLVDHHAAGLPFRKPLMIHGKATVTIALALVPA